MSKKVVDICIHMGYHVSMVDSSCNAGVLMVNLPIQSKITDGRQGGEGWALRIMGIMLNWY